MKKPISRKLHGAADYAYAAVAAALPEIAGFEQEENAVRLARIIGGSTLTYTLMTRAEWGLLKLIPFKAHLATDFTAGIFTLAAPWLFSFSKNKNARNAFLAMGITSVAASLLTQSEEL